MFISNQLNKIKTIYEYYGKRAQLEKVVEELNELITEVEFHINSDHATNDGLFDELVDVYVVLEYIILTKGFTLMDIRKRADFKLDRTLKRMELQKKREGKTNDFNQR